MECKGRIVKQGGIEALVLIETSWNVKNAYKEITEYEYDVLIETSWNVKRKN